MGRPQPQGADFADLSIEELANIQVTSVSKKPERLQDAPASVFVITADDIRRAGAPQACRKRCAWRRTCRWRRQCQLCDHRARPERRRQQRPQQAAGDDRRPFGVHAAVFRRVLGRVQDVMLEDVERIEVISGPGGTCGA
jgi:iron complex outermembrane receptor protein